MSRALSASPCGLADFRVKGIAGFVVSCSVEFTVWVDLQCAVFEGLAASASDGSRVWQCFGCCLEWVCLPASWGLGLVARANL